MYFLYCTGLYFNYAKLEGNSALANDTELVQELAVAGGRELAVVKHQESAAGRFHDST